MDNLKTHISPRLRYLIDNNQQHLLCNGLKGIEKESLRISKQGAIASTTHPKALGAALTHPSITTDYSEALLEFITEPFADIKQTLASMHQIHQFVYQNLGNEILLAASMPCGINGDKSIPIAEYGSSNIGKMKHIYRKGLWHRYGRTMQAIAGIHFNYSVPKPLWQALKQQHNNPEQSLEDFISENYFKIIRNFQRQGWLILYLFGASPAICKNFFKSRPQLMSQFVEFDKYTLYHPSATSLRMSDIGYKSKNQASLKINYNSLDGYVDTLTAAMNTPYADYENIGVKVDGEYNQLSGNILQIENEFYNTVRPKQIMQSGEKPTLALKRRGVEYIEIRSLDLDLFNPIGIDEDKARFVEAFLLHCLLEDSPLQTEDEQAINNSNQLTVAHAGRQENTVLNKHGEIIPLRKWAGDILEAMQPVCEILDANDANKPYRAALKLKQSLVKDSALTPSAKILQQMREQEIPFGRFGLDASAEHEKYFKSLPPLDDAIVQQFKEMATESYQKQARIEADDNLGFDEFLANYFTQH
ncbi:MAG: glutamate--cysteine ligase [Methylococcaceae bacterium]|nr:glutamate--cysteine ligase [Methylococcaceae bacterium]